MLLVGFDAVLIRQFDSASELSRCHYRTINDCPVNGVCIERVLNNRICCTFSRATWFVSTNFPTLSTSLLHSAPKHTALCSSVKHIIAVGFGHFPQHHSSSNAFTQTFDTAWQAGKRKSKWNFNLKRLIKRATDRSAFNRTPVNAWVGWTWNFGGTKTMTREKLKENILSANETRMGLVCFIKSKLGKCFLKIMHK